MIVSGLNSNRFLAGNPIPVTMSLDGASFVQGKYITMSITKLIEYPDDVLYTLPPVKLFPSPSGITIDLAPYIKGLLRPPYIPGDSYILPIPNLQKFNITFSENQTDSSNVFLNKAFIRGFKREESDSAFTISIGEELVPAGIIPVWSGYPYARFGMRESSTIGVYTVVEPQYVKQMRLPTNCDPFYVRFLDSLGGYSQWMFNSWDWETKTKGGGVIERTASLGNRSLGFKEENMITVDTRVRREFFPLIRDLLCSPVIQVYDKFASGKNWKKIEIKGDSITQNNYEDVMEITLTFDLMLNNKPEVIW